jgi:enoyl-CoA hydratase
MPNTLLVEQDPSGYAVLTLNRPERLNALSRELRAELAAAIDQLAADESVRVLILTGAGRAFCAGLDLKELGASTDDPLLFGARDRADPVAAMARCRKPIIGAINGAAVTGGFEIALACDLLIASTEARFADTHARIGVMPGWGLSQRLPRLVGLVRAKELSLTGNFLSAEQASQWGVVSRVVAPAELMSAARKLAADMLSAVPHMLPALKAVIDEGYAVDFGEGLALERDRARGANAAVSAGEIEQRREAVRSRGRGQG